MSDLRGPERPASAVALPSSHRADGRSRRILPPHHYGTGQHKQRAGPGVRGSHRIPVVAAGSLWIMADLNVNMMP